MSKPFAPSKGSPDGVLKGKEPVAAHVDLTLMVSVGQEEE